MKKRGETLLDGGLHVDPLYHEIGKSQRTKYSKLVEK